MITTINEYKQDLIHSNCSCCSITESFEYSLDNEQGIRIIPITDKNEIDDILYNSTIEYEWDARNGYFMVPCEEHECDEMENELNQLLSEYNYKIETTY